MKIKELYEETDMTLEQIAREIGKSYAYVWEYIKNNYDPAFRKNRKVRMYSLSKHGNRNPMYDKRGTAHHNYIGKVRDSKGYLLSLKPAWYTARKGCKHIFMHHLVVCEEMGLTQIPPRWCVHHCDGNKLNNNFSNLVLMLISDHSRLHVFLKGATTISKESTLKWVEKHGTIFNREDIV